jgi:hypothetical protein
MTPQRETLSDIERKISAQLGEEEEFLDDKLSDNIDEDEIDSDEETLDEDASEEQDDDSEEQPKKLTSKEQKAIIALRRKNKELQEENRRLARERSEAASNKRKEDLKAKYVADGYDADVAENMAERDERLAQQEERLATIEFREENYDVLSRYPEAKKDVLRIMRAVENTGMTVEQVCRGMYGGDMNATQRARAAAEGRLYEDDGDNPISRATFSAERRTGVQLSASDRRKKAILEEDLLHRKVSNKRYLELKDKYNL